MSNNWIIEKLKTNKIKATKPRLLIAKYLEEKDGIFCARDIAKKIKNIDKVSVYRTLEIMQKKKIINPVITLDGDQYYEKNDAHNHHHHIICTRCRKTECVDCTEPKIKQTKKFNNLNHLLIFTGICHSCTK